MRTLIHLSLFAALALTTLLPVRADAPPAATPAVPGKPTFAAVLSGKVVPLSLHLQDMATGWSAFTSGTAISSQSLEILTHAATPSPILRAILTTCYTRGQTIELGGVSFLVIYARSEATFRSLFLRAEQEQVDPLTLLKVTPETEVTLQLIDVRTIGDISGIHLFSPQEILRVNALIEQTLLLAKEQKSLDKLGQLASATQDFIQENNGKLPPLDSLAHFQKAIVDYLDDDDNDDTNDDLVLQSLANSPYLINFALMGKKLTDFPHPEEVVLVYEAQPWPDGKRGVGYLDGNAGLVTEAEWAKIQATVKAQPPAIR